MLRHDIDFRPSKIELFTDVEESLDIRCDIYVILDDNFYNIKEYIPKLKKLHVKGHTLGLHTLAPGNEDYKEIFKSELSLFEEYFGFAPKYFTIHGKAPRPKNWQEKRDEFLNYVKDNQKELKIVGSHNINSPYDWVEDISINSNEYSVLRRKFFELNKNYYYGVIGVLTHPVHWSQNDVCWDTGENNYKSILD